MAVPQTRLRDRLKPANFKPGKMSGWLPAVALFLCLSMFAIAALILFQVGSDPQTPQSALPTSVSAQGFNGLRRVLDADGHFTVINRFEDDGPAQKGDLEIITLDDPSGLFTGGYDALEEEAASRSAEAASSSDSESRPADAELAKAQARGIGQVPDPRRVNHIFDKPLGKAVLVVVPKWDAKVWPRKPRWAQGATLRDARDIAEVLQVLSPVTETDTQYDDDGNIIVPAKIPGKQTHVGYDSTITYAVVPYDIQRRTRPAAPAIQAPATAGRGRSESPEPIVNAVVLTPAPGQSLYMAPLQAGQISGLQTLTGPNLVPVLLSSEGRPVLSRLVVPGRPTKVPVYVLSDPDLLNNQILASPQKVVNALDLLDRITPPSTAHRKIVFNMTFNGLSFDRDLLYALSRPPFLAVPLALLILGLALMWAAFARFGPAQESPAGPPLGRGVRTLADNAARLMAVTFKETKLGPAYATLVRDQVIRSRGYMQVDPSQSLDDLAERIGKTHGASDSYLTLKDKAARVATVHQLIDVTLKLHAWKTEIERAHI